MLWQPLAGGFVQCFLCAHRCRIGMGRRGICRVRENREGELASLVCAGGRGLLVAEHVDPVEKKPLYHFLPGSSTYSIATVGCNLSCAHCQNWEISLAAREQSPLPGRWRSAAEVVDAALSSGCRSLSFTYTEPNVFLEFALACAREGKGRGLRSIFVTNGFWSPEARDAAGPWMDAANVDLKGATESHYRTVCHARLAPVEETIRDLRARGVWVEVTTLLIPGLNDDEPSLRHMAGFIAGVDPLIPWHVSRFFPTYRMADREPTPVASLERAVEAGKAAGLAAVYPGNAPQLSDSTPCRGCGATLLRRRGFQVTENLLTAEGRCPGCGMAMGGVFERPPNSEKSL